jgi:cytoskeletal protein RodZ
MDDDFDFDTMVPEEPSRNRTFWYFLIGLVGIVLVTIIGILLWINVFSPRQQEARYAGATQTAAAEMERALAQVPSSTPVQLPSSTPGPTNTQAPTQTAVPPAQSTTSVPTTQPTIVRTVVPTPTELPSTGFADELGLPGLMSLAFTLVIIAFIARRIRVGITN